MSLVLHPENSFTVVRQIANHTDSATYYVRAVIRNAYTDAIITTLDLVDRGSQRFSKNWTVPADPSGQGFYVSIVTSVYTDSAYTTKSENYGDEENTYLVQDRLSHRGGGGASVDYFRVRQIIKEELGSLPKPPDFDYERIPKPKDFTDRTDEILEAVRSIDMKAEKIEQKNVDLSPLLEAIRETKQAIEDKEVTPETDLSPVLSRLQEDKEDGDITMEELKGMLSTMEAKLEEAIKTNITETINNTEFTSTFATRAQPKKAAKQEEAEPIDFKRLAL